MPAPKRILVVDAEPESRQRIAQSLAPRPVECIGVGTAQAAVAEARKQPPDLVILDLDLPDQTGLGLCRVLREEPPLVCVPILVVTAQASEVDRVLAFEAGADDFLSKPFYPPELAARVAAVLRGYDARDKGGRDAEQSPGLHLDSSRRLAEVHGRRVDLTTTEFEILWALVTQAGRVVRRRELIEKLVGAAASQSDRAVDAHVKSIRRKLGEARDCVETVRGVGYRYRDPARS
jgi:two-component system phosphate regulon response regulator PhoB